MTLSNDRLETLENNVALLNERFGSLVTEMLMVLETKLGKIDRIDSSVEAIRASVARLTQQLDRQQQDIRQILTILTGKQNNN